MQLIQFVNNAGEALAPGDVVVVGAAKISHYQDPAKTMPIVEVDLTDRAYDTRVCGVVYRVHLDTASPVPGTDRKAAAKRPSRKADATALIRRAATLGEMTHVEQSRVEHRQLGYLVTHGAYAFCKVDADVAAVTLGDLLTTSPRRGHAQKVVNRAEATGAILGKALGSLRKGTGIIPVLVMLQ